MRRIVFGLVVIVALLAVWWWRGRDREAAPARQASAAGGSGSAIANPAASGPPTRVRKVTAEERRALAERIAAAQAARAGHASAAHGATPRPALPDGSEAESHDLERIQTHVLDALKGAIPFLAECYNVHAPATAKGGMTAVAQMTLTGDPDIGTVIDADQIFDDQHQPIAKELDDCLRGTMQTLELPPLDEGDSVKIQYSFRFDDQ